MKHLGYKKTKYYIYNMKSYVTNCTTRGRLNQSIQIILKNTYPIAFLSWAIS